jgi:SAM-dependent methyltransferase
MTVLFLCGSIDKYRYIGGIMDEKSIHSAVRDHYGAIARSMSDPVSASASCCGDSSDSCGCSNMSLYDSAMLDGLPASVTNLSLGCGDPVSIASLQPGDVVVDLGSGGGIDCFLASKRVGPQGMVIGIDMTPDMLAKANANKEKMGVRNVEFRQGQIEALPVESGTVDVVMSNCVINLSPDKRAVFNEAFRVLRSGGRVSISDVVTEGEFSPEQRAQADQWSACVTGAIDVSAYTGMMRDAGFVDIQVVDKTDAADVVTPPPGMPRVFSARVTARKS